MALLRRALLALGFCTLLFSSEVSSFPKGFFGESPTSTQVSLEEDEQPQEQDKHSLWEDSEDVFDLDGDNWINQSPAASMSTWPTLNQPPKSMDFDDASNDVGVIDDDDEDESDEADDGQQNDPSEFMLVPEVKADGGKRDVKVRQEVIGEDIPDDTEDDSAEKNASYDLISDPENVEEENVDNDLFGDRYAEDSKKLFEDFLI